MENELHKAQALLKRGFEAVFRRSGGKDPQGRSARLGTGEGRAARQK